MKLPKSFYRRNTEKVACDLLGCILVHVSPEGVTSGRIVETEAYLHNDPASHSFSGQTSRNAAMFENGGVAYVYFTYGKYFCFNAVTSISGMGEAVLIRALEPLEGIGLMEKRRGVFGKRDLCNGPAKLVIAMGIDKSHNTYDLTSDVLFIRKDPEHRVVVEAKPRIGVSQGKDLLLRFCVKDSLYVSKG